LHSQIETSTKKDKKNKIFKEMTKADIINKIADETGIAKKDVAATVEAFMEEIRVSLASNKENVYLRGFGSFIVKHRAQKTARNISKNTTLVIDAHDLPAFKPAKSFIAKMK
jgi:DNA-binding protein HU-beta